jgi:hypothetical protein
MGVSLELAISAIRSGRREEGRQLLNLLIQQDPNNDKAWLWMSSVVDNDDQRARCLYHVLAIDPNSELARRGLQVLGIVVSDSRPIKAIRDSQPAQAPQLAATTAVSAAAQPEAEKTPSEPRRPFLINPQAITQELPFKPLRPPVPEPIHASPAILSIDVEAVLREENEATKSDEGAQKQATVQPERPASGWPQSASPSAAVAGPTKTQKMESKFEPISVLSTPRSAMRSGQLSPQAQSPAASTKTQRMVAKDETTTVDDGVKTTNPVAHSQEEAQPDPANPQQPAANTAFPGGYQETRPSHPVPVNYAPMNPGMAPNNQMPYYPALPSPADMSVGMPSTQYMQPQQYPPGMYAGHANVTMGMALPNQAGQFPYPPEPMPALQAHSGLGMPAYDQGQLPPLQNLAFHSSATMMMPTMTEAEARARLNAGPVANVAAMSANATAMSANATAMALQNGAHVYGMAVGNPLFEEDEDQEAEGGEMNILAIIIFGTLSVTALGGFGMIILLMLTAPA